MIEWCNGDLFESGCEALVNPVNTVGAMGRGLAAEFRARYPRVFTEYRTACLTGQLTTGAVYVVALTAADRLPDMSPEARRARYIVHFPTKAHWRNPSRMEYVESGLADLVMVVKDTPIRSIAIPALGCGLGGLSWAEVRPMMIRAAVQMEPAHVRMYGPKV